jgi:hypothetical protein
MDLQLHFSDIFDVDPGDLREFGAFNISLINDLPLFIDPFLLFTSKKQEYLALHEEIIRYVRFLREMSEEGTIGEGLLRSWFLFSEVKQTWLGYSQIGNEGSGLGLEFAYALHRNLHTIFSNFGSEQITRGSHLEKLCLIKDGVGRDNISDFTTNLIKDFLLRYTQAFSLKHLHRSHLKSVPIPRVRFNYSTRTWEQASYELPWYQNDYVILTPKDILTKDETWINKADLMHEFQDITISIPNAELRGQLNQYLLRMLPKNPTQKEMRGGILQTIEQFPQLIDFYIRYKEDHGAEAISISEQRVREIETLFIEQLREFAASLLKETNFYRTGWGTYKEAKARVLFLKDVIENKGGHKLFYVGNAPLRRESDLHILFRLTWFATPSDVTREANNGRGPVDFKISRGSFDKSLVEFKLASNTHLRRNLEKQVPIYEKAADAKQSIRAIIYFTDEELEKVLEMFRDLKLEGNPDIVLIDARSTNKPPGSKA